MIFSHVDIQSIDLSQELFRLDDSNPAPIQWDGRQPLFHPVWLQRMDAGAYRIVDGFRVIALARTICPDQAIPALVFPEGSSLTGLWKLRAEKRAYEGNLSILTYLRGIFRLMQALQLTILPNSKDDWFFPGDISPCRFERDNLSEILGRFPNFQSFVEIHKLNYKDLCRLGSVPSSKLNDLSELLQGLKLKGKKLSSLLDLIDELERGYAIGSDDLLSDEKLTTIRLNMQPHQRYGAIKQRLLELRFPRLQQLKENWEEALRNADLSDGVDVRHDPDFEEETLQFVFTSQNAAQLQHQLKTVLSKTDTPELCRLFQLI